MQIQSFKQNRSKGKYKIDQEHTYVGDDYWEWKVWIEGTDINLDKIESVTYTLHYTFVDPVRMIRTREDKFSLHASGWGTFTIYAVLNFKDKSVLPLEHELELFYPDGTLTSE